VTSPILAWRLYDIAQTYEAHYPNHMLSYQHHFHAGNLADVHKHAMLCYMLDYLTQKDKPLSYIETHSGRGLYDLDAPEAKKTGEAQAGVLQLEQHIASDHPYRHRLAEARAQHGPAAYPGSPMLAALSLRDTDTMHLAELHPSEVRHLRQNMMQWGAHIYENEGFSTARAVCPPTPRRGLMLIDPSYEVKAEYETIPKTIWQLHRKWNVGVICLWYPILDTAPHALMLADLTAGHPNFFRHEVRFPPIRQGHRMVGSGLFILNPPFGIEDEAARLTTVFAKA
jgi:23S rRNA (adenine2030-N6)-methyltransferase